MIFKYPPSTRTSTNTSTSTSSSTSTSTRTSTKHQVMSSTKGPNLKSYLDKQVTLSLNKNRKVTGTLRGYDQFMNIVLGEAVEEVSVPGGSKAENNIGMVVVRGNSILQFELVGR